jgi:hypothetical protein
MSHPLEMVVRGFQIPVRNQHDLNLVPGFELGNFGPLLVQQISGHLDRYLHPDRRGAFLHRLFLHHPQDVQRR